VIGDWLVFFDIQLFEQELGDEKELQNYRRKFLFI